MTPTEHAIASSGNMSIGNAWIYLLINYVQKPPTLAERIVEAGPSLLAMALAAVHLVWAVLGFLDWCYHRTSKPQE